jgi:hypothetical protein
MCSCRMNRGMDDLDELDGLLGDLLMREKCGAARVCVYQILLY